MNVSTLFIIISRKDTAKLEKNKINLDFITICFTFAAEKSHYMSVKIQEVITALERFAPLPLQESYDNAGLQIGLTGAEVSGVLLYNCDI